MTLKPRCAGCTAFGSTGPVKMVHSYDSYCKLESKAMTDEETVRAAWALFANAMSSRGWYVLAGDHDMSVCIPGPNSPQDDQYVEVWSL